MLGNKQSLQLSNCTITQAKVVDLVNLIRLEISQGQKNRVCSLHLTVFIHLYSL